jgi:hypothetical protein
MGRYIKIASVLAVLCLLGCLGCYAVDPDSRDLKREKLVQQTEAKRKALIDHASQYVGITEKTGRNDGPEIERWQRTVGRKKYDAYCTAFVSTMFYDLNIPAPLTGWSPAMFSSNVIYERKVDWRKGIVFPPGSVGGFFYPELGRIAHSFFIEFSERDRSMTIQANTSFSGAVQSDADLTSSVREGQGVARKWVRNQTIYIVSDYVGSQLVRYDWRKSGVYSKLKTINE